MIMPYLSEQTVCATGWTEATLSPAYKYQITADSNKKPISHTKAFEKLVGLRRYRTVDMVIRTQHQSQACVSDPTLVVDSSSKFLT